MINNVKELWYNALIGIDSEFEISYCQNKTQNLRDAQGFNALGVLCDIHFRETGEGAWQKNELLHCWLYKNQQYVLPIEVACWAGIPESPLLDRFLVPVIINGVPTSIGALNDNHDFQYISEVIEIMD